MTSIKADNLNIYTTTIWLVKVFHFHPVTSSLHVYKRWDNYFNKPAGINQHSFAVGRLGVQGI